MTLVSPTFGGEAIMDVLYGVRMTGPLTPYARGLADELTRLGFTTFSARGQMGMAVHLSRWLARADLDAMSLTAATVEAYLTARRTAGYTAYLTPKALAPLLGYLRELGVAPLPVIAAPATAAEELLERYRGYLLLERGLEVRAARGYLDLVRPFIAGHAGTGGEELRRLTAAEVSAFLVAESRRLSPKTTQRLASALRSLLRFWHVQGLIGGPLELAVPKVANRRTALPRGLEPAQVQAMLVSCDQTSAAGRRDLAILTMLARLGLRAGEVAGLRLEDIDWRLGELTICGKGNRRDRLPLPDDVGQTVVEYLRHGRPSTALDRSVFIRIKAPHHGLTSGGVTQAVAAAAKRAGLGTIYAHRLRHSAATAMLAEGASLTEIGQVLRHRRPLTTAIYAKVDIEALRALARPWPISGPGAR
jgi:integrase/recombinase XerD